MNESPEYGQEACGKHYAEEDWIDWLLGRKPASDREAMARHASQCVRCRTTRETWMPLLAGGGGDGGTYGSGAGRGTLAEPGGSADLRAADRNGHGQGQGQGHGHWHGHGHGLGQSQEHAIGHGHAQVREQASMRERVSAPGYAEGGMSGQAMPSVAVYNRLRLRIRLRSAGLRVRRALHAQRRTAAAAVAAAAIVLVCMTGLYRTAPNQADQRKVDAAALEPGAASFLDDPQTAGFKVRPELEELGEGYIWFNDASGEVYVMLEGLLPSDGHDVQVWAVDEREHQHVNLGLLHQDRFSRAHLYVKRDMLLQTHRIALTVEPAGGSSNPTEPDVLVFRLRRD